MLAQHPVDAAGPGWRHSPRTRVEVLGTAGERAGQRLLEERLTEVGQLGLGVGAVEVDDFLQRAGHVAGAGPEVVLDPGTELRQQHEQLVVPDLVAGRRQVGVSTIVAPSAASRPSARSAAASACGE